MEGGLWESLPGNDEGHAAQAIKLELHVYCHLLLQVGPLAKFYKIPLSRILVVRRGVCFGVQAGVRSSTLAQSMHPWPTLPLLPSTWLLPRLQSSSHSQTVIASLHAHHAFVIRPSFSPVPLLLNLSDV